MKRILLKILLFFRNLVLGLVVLIFLALVLLRLPVVQQALIPIIESNLGKVLKTKVEIGEIDIAFPNRAVLRDVTIYDHQGQEFVKAAELSTSMISIPFWKLIFSPDESKTLRLATLDLVQPVIRLYKSRKDSLLNIRFLSSDEPDTSSAPGTLTLDFPNIRIGEGQFSYVDSTLSDSVLAVKGTVNFGNLDLKHLNTRVGLKVKPDGELDPLLYLLRFEDQVSGLKVDDLKAKVHLDSNGVRLRELFLHAGSTKVALNGDIKTRDSLQMDFQFRPSKVEGLLVKKFAKAVPLEGVLGLEGPLTIDPGGQHIHSDSLNLQIRQATRLDLSMDLNDFAKPNGLKMAFDFRHSTLAFEDLSYLMPSLKLPLSSGIYFLGKVEGDMNTLRIPNLLAGAEASTFLDIHGSIQQYTQPERMKLDLNLRNSTIKFTELKHVLPDVTIPDPVKRIGVAEVDGHFKGSLSDMEAQVDILSPKGTISADAKLKIPSQNGKAMGRLMSYQAALKVQDLQLKELGLLDSDTLNYEGKIMGQGNTLNSLFLFLEGKFTRTWMAGYRFDTLLTSNFRVKNRKATGILNLQDAEGDASFNLTAILPDLEAMERNKRAKQKDSILPVLVDVVVQGDVGGLDLQHYGLVEYPLDLTTVMNIKVKGDSLENLTGRIKFFNLNMTRPDSGTGFRISNARLDFRENSPVKKNLDFKSSVGNLELKGNFSFQDGQNLVTRLLKEATLYAENNQDSIEAYYAQKVLDTHQVDIELNLKSRKPVNQVFAFFDIPLYLENGTTLKAKLTGGRKDLTKIKLKSDTLKWGTLVLAKTDLDMNLDKIEMQNSIEVEGEATVDNFWVGNAVHLQNLGFEPDIKDNVAKYAIKADQPELGNRYYLNGKTTLRPNSILTSLNPTVSKLRIGGRDWLVNKNNKIDYAGGKLIVEDLQLINDEQQISIEGVVSESNRDTLFANIDRLNLESVTSVLEDTIPVSGEIDFLRLKLWSALGNNPIMQFRTFIRDLSYDMVDSVNVRVLGAWQSNILALSSNWGHGQVANALNIKGLINLQSMWMDFRSDDSNIPVEWAGPFLAGVLSDMEGKVKVDKLLIKGKPGNLNIDGDAHFSGTRFKVDYLNTVFAFDNRSVLHFDKEQIRFPQDGLALMDTLGNSARISGTITHSGENSPRINIGLKDIRNLTFMDTKRQEGQPFYGRLVLEEGWATVRGPVSNLEVNARVRTGESNLDIPLTEYTTASRLDFVNFVDEEKDTVKTEIDLSGFTLNLGITVTDQALVRLIFDEKVGDIIEARGVGPLTMVLDSKGKFKMTGDLEIRDGGYLFTAENIVNKKFILKEGGHITWTGDPYDARLDLEAGYKVTANLGDLLGEEQSGTKIPVEIIMQMTGNLSSPVISLALRLDQLADEDVAGLASYFRNIQYDEQELNKQVVSLLLFRRFASSSGTGGISGASGVFSSISELISNQVNYWISQVIKADVGVAVNTNSFDDLELELRASLFNDRVTIERTGTLLSNQNNGTVSLGDISVLVKLLPNPNAKDTNYVPDPYAGQLVLEIFNRENATLSNVNSNTTGAGIFYKKDFDQLIDLFRSRKNLNKRKQQAIILD